MLVLWFTDCENRSAFSALPCSLSPPFFQGFKCRAKAFHWAVAFPWEAQTLQDIRISLFCSQTPAVPKVAGSELAHGMCRSTPPCAQQCPSQGCQHPQQITSCAHCYHWHASGGADKIPLRNSIAAQEFHYLPISPTTPIPPREHQLGCCWSRDVCPKSSWNQALGENRTSVLPVEEWQSEQPLDCFPPAVKII